MPHCLLNIKLRSLNIETKYLPEDFKFLIPDR